MDHLGEKRRPRSVCECEHESPLSWHPCQPTSPRCWGRAPGRGPDQRCSSCRRASCWCCSEGSEVTDGNSHSPASRPDSSRVWTQLPLLPLLFPSVARTLPSDPHIQVPELGLWTSRMRGLPVALGCSRIQVAEYSSLGGLRLAFRGKLVTPRAGSQGLVGGRQSWHCLVLRAGNKDPELCSGHVALGA